jgi:hypothetical protein
LLRRRSTLALGPALIATLSLLGCADRVAETRPVSGASATQERGSIGLDQQAAASIEDSVVAAEEIRTSLDQEFQQDDN